MQTTLDADPLDADAPKMQTSPDEDLPRARPPWMQTPLDADPLVMWPVLDARKPPPPLVDRQTPVKTIPCPKLRLVVKQLTFEPFFCNSLLNSWVFGTCIKNIQSDSYVSGVISRALKLDFVSSNFGSLLIKIYRLLFFAGLKPGKRCQLIRLLTQKNISMIFTNTGTDRIYYNILRWLRFNLCTN